MGSVLAANVVLQTHEMSFSGVFGHSQLFVFGCGICLRFESAQQFKRPFFGQKTATSGLRMATTEVSYALLSG